MNDIQWKKMLYILIPAAVILVTAYWATWRPADLSKKNAAKQEEQAAITQSEGEQKTIPMANEQQDGEIDNTDDAEDGAANTEGRELLGTITEVYETEDPNHLLLTVEADIAGGEMVPLEAIQAESDEEMAVTQKSYEVSVAKNTPIVGGTVEELTEDDFLLIVTKENVANSSELTAVSIEEL